MEWEQDDDDQQDDNKELYGGRQVYTDVLQQGLLLINQDQTMGQIALVHVTDMGPGFAEKHFISDGSIATIICIFVVLVFGGFGGYYLYQRRLKQQVVERNSHLINAHYPGAIQRQQQITDHNEASQ